MLELTRSHHPWLATLIVLGLIGAVIYWPDSTPAPAANTTRAPSSSRTGHPTVYAEIDSSTNCTGLQATLDQHMANAEGRKPGDSFRMMSFSYAEAADDRMRALGCYK